MDFEDFLATTGEWLKAEGNDSDIILSSRIRLARNLQNFPFTSRASFKQTEESETYIASAMKEIPELQEYIYLVLNYLQLNDIHLLFERHLISKEHAVSSAKRSVFFKRDETISIMINEEDHLRIQAIRSGFNASELWKTIDVMDDTLEAHLPYAFHKQFGYLTACPTNAGTGMRISVMMHLPALKMTQQIDRIHANLQKHRLMMRGFYGEGTLSTGDLFQVCNQSSLGKTEKELVHIFNSVVPQILHYERDIREKMVKQNYASLKKSVDDALQTLSDSQSLSTEEAMTHLSLIRMGIYLGMVSMDIHKANKLFIMCQPAHLQKLIGEYPDTALRDQARAQYFKNILRCKGQLDL